MAFVADSVFTDVDLQVAFGADKLARVRKTAAERDALRQEAVNDIEGYFARLPVPLTTPALSASRMKTPSIARCLEILCRSALSTADDAWDKLSAYYRREWIADLYGVQSTAASGGSSGGGSTTAPVPGPMYSVRAVRR